MKQKKLIVGILIFSMMAMYGSVPTARAVDSLTDVKDTLSSSANSDLATHTINFTNATVVPASGYVIVTLPAEFGDITAGTCSLGAVATTTDTFRCNYTPETATGTAQTITLVDVQNPATTDSYVITIETRDSGNIAIDRSEIRVSIIDQVLMTARVSATLSFTISGLDAGTTINNVATTATSTATTTPFGTLNINATSTVGQELSVATNADAGYVVTVEQDDELTNTTGSTINSFNNSPDNTGSTTPGIWADPLNTLDAQHTYGHMGLTTDDSTNVGGETFGPGLYAGLNNTDPLQIMAHTGPSDGSTQDKGLAKVLYAVKIASLQEAGDYQNTLTYICTPTF